MGILYTHYKKGYLKSNTYKGPVQIKKIYSLKQGTKTHNLLKILVCPDGCIILKNLIYKLN